MSIIKKILYTLVMMLLWGIGKEVAQKIQGSNAGFLTLIVSIVCVTIILDIWSGFFLFSKKIEADDNIQQNDPVKEVYLQRINNVSNSIPQKQHVMPVRLQEPVTDKKIFTNMNNDITSNSEMINDEVFYLRATKEVDEGNQDQALWAKYMALCEGDEYKAKYMYIKERAGRLVIAEKDILAKENKQLDESRRSIEKEKQRTTIKLYLSENNAKFANLLSDNGLSFYKSKYGPYVFTQEGVDETKIFASEDEFKRFLEELLPTLKGFNQG